MTNTSDAIVLSTECKGPNRACKAAHKAGLSVHVIDDPRHPDNAVRGALVLPTYHFATVAEGVAAVKDAIANAKTVGSDEEWLRLEDQEQVAFRTRPGFNHPTRR